MTDTRNDVLRDRALNQKCADCREWVFTVDLCLDCDAPVCEQCWREHVCDDDRRAE